MRISDRSIQISSPKRQENLLGYLGETVEKELAEGEIPLRFVIPESNEKAFYCELATMSYIPHQFLRPSSIFQFRKRQFENNQEFNAVVLVPTGINCEIGGHAGDATPAARLLASLCDNLIVHPNVVNASDINELTENCLVVEGSTLSRLLMGTVGLQKVRANRILALLENMDEFMVTEAAINSVSAARATLGINVSEIICLKKPCQAQISYAASGRTSGVISHLETLLEVLMKHQDGYDAVALVTALGSEDEQLAMMQDYYLSDTINPWGGIEAMFSHTISTIIEKPSMHAPMLESTKPIHFGLVDPQKASEVVSRTYMNCILKGLHRSPKLVSNPLLFGKTGILSAEDIHCLIIPEGALGLPTLAALEQGIPVIAVRENRNLMRNKLEILPFAKGKYFLVDNYLEAAGLMAALKAGVEVAAVRRPFTEVPIVEVSPDIEEEFVW